MIFRKQYLLLALALFISIGCGGSDTPELGFVTGTVTMDGKPLPGVMIAFMPASGRPSTANVDQDGKYELFYTRNSAGTKVGANTVTFQWPTGATGPSIAARYAEKSELKVDVKAGKNTFDFDLKSEPGSAPATQQTPVIVD